MTKFNLEDLKEDWARDYSVKNVYKESSGFLFHYTTRENLWNIIESDSMYARNVRFSNDSEEYTLGKKTIERLSNKEISNVDDCYMICFCEKGNILSQWREYARGGVSIMMELRGDTFYTIKVSIEMETENEKKYKNKPNNQYYIPGYKFQPEFAYVNAYAKPIRVKYIDPKKDELAGDIEKIREGVKENEEMLEERCLKTLIPYIKHKGFEEEKEVRLIFKVNKGMAFFQVGYLNDKGMCRPYIRVEMGDASKKEEFECQVGLYNIPANMINDIKKKLIGEKLEIEVLDENAKEQKENIVIRFVKETTKRIPYETGHIYIGSCKYQEYVFRFFDHYVESNNIKGRNKINIWCEGHLPIREIMVGPSNDKDELRESIEHKMRNIYWLKYVQVDVSDIPYRSKQ